MLHKRLYRIDVFPEFPVYRERESRRILFEDWTRRLAPAPLARRELEKEVIPPLRTYLGRISSSIRALFLDFES